MNNNTVKKVLKNMAQNETLPIVIAIIINLMIFGLPIYFMMRTDALEGSWICVSYEEGNVITEIDFSIKFEFDGHDTFIYSEKGGSSKTGKYEYSGKELTLMAGDNRQQKYKVLDLEDEKMTIKEASGDPPRYYYFTKTEN